MKRIAIDGMIYLYQFINKIQYGSTYLKSASGEVTSHLQGFLFRTIRLLERDYLPIYVFDGKHHPLKHHRPHTISFPIGDLKKSSIELLSLMGVPVVTAAYDGEAECAILSSLDTVEFASSKDLDDCFAFGTKLAIGDDLRPERDEISIISGTKPIAILDLPRWLERCKLPPDWTREQYVDYRLLMGTDYNSKCLPPHIGTPRAIKLLANSTLEDSEYWSDDLSAVKEYLMHPPAVPIDPKALKLKTPDPAAIRHFLAKESFDPKRVEKAVDRLTTATKTARSTKTLDRWMR
jgi:flap endonuclease-1